ncbi:hypothetical protein [Parabacteroides sp. AM08-6]|uniref:hypothetical protein n=1 Tax=Parabacteroides sp. AM08-6 TaxID=2292053 RepID=UPI0011C3E7E2|nr:hypothetical protein [Parabacteroides sp. AM08-6]
MWVLQCPLCSEILASASEREYLPEFSTCDCDRNGNKQPAYELFIGDAGKQMIRRNKYPRFTAEVMFEELSDIENVQLLDDCTDTIELARAMRKAGEFLLKSSRNGKR